MDDKDIDLLAFQGEVLIQREKNERNFKKSLKEKMFMESTKEQMEEDIREIKGMLVSKLKEEEVNDLCDLVDAKRMALAYIAMELRSEFNNPEFSIDSLTKCVRKVISLAENSPDSIDFDFDSWHKEGN